ncbi:MAG: glycerate kinase [Clostridia bacterium]|nr:glycerate kinase [Clostridia bacterium]
MNIYHDAKQIIDHSIRAVLPDVAVLKALQSTPLDGPAFVVAIGKAAWRMAHAAGQALGDQMKAGIVITKYGHSEGSIPRMDIYEAGHPVPDANGVVATRHVLNLVGGLTERDTVVFLVSGGGSALFELPLDGVSLDDIADTTRQFLACGADIVEINTIRKHLSAVKGGRFAQRCAPARVLSIVLSDVLGDPLDSIASGPSYPDSSRCEDVQTIFKRYHLDIAPHMMGALSQETPKSLPHTKHMITGNVRALCEAAKEKAASLGYTPMLLTTTLNCEAREAGLMLAAIAREIRASSFPLSAPCAVILGGETVVHVRGRGKGGRNQELALSAGSGIAGLEDTLIFSVGSDGTDGPTDAAGGIVTGEFMDKCKACGLSVEAFLADNDAYTLLNQTDSLIVTGPTGTNVNDLTVLLCR